MIIVAIGALKSSLFNRAFPVVNKLSTLISLACLCIVVQGCATKSPTGVDSESDHGINPILFIDIDSFDKNLESKLEKGSPSVVVSLVGESTTVNQIPPRLQKWLSAVDKYGDGISLKYDDPDGGNESAETPKNAVFILSMLMDGYKLVKHNAHKALMSNYGATIHLREDTGGIQKIEFNSVKK